MACTWLLSCTSHLSDRRCALLQHFVMDFWDSSKCSLFNWLKERESRLFVADLSSPRSTASDVDAAPSCYLPPSALLWSQRIWIERSAVVFASLTLLTVFIPLLSTPLHLAALRRCNSSLFKRKISDNEEIKTGEFIGRVFPSVRRLIGAV